MTSKMSTLFNLHTDTGEIVYLDKATEMLSAIVKDNLADGVIDIVLPDCSPTAVQAVVNIIKIGATAVAATDVDRFVDVGKLLLGVDFSSLFDHFFDQGMISSKTEVYTSQKFKCSRLEKEEVFMVTREIIKKEQKDEDTIAIRGKKKKDNFDPLEITKVMLLNDVSHNGFEFYNMESEQSQINGSEFDRNCVKIENYQEQTEADTEYNPGRTHVCHICGKAFPSPSILRVHISSSVHENHRPYSCLLCDKTFTQQCHLNKHQFVHSGERNYSCNVEGCDKAFKQRWHLVQHERLHTGEKPAQCKLCGRQFSQTSSLANHMKARHNINKS